MLLYCIKTRSTQRCQHLLDVFLATRLDHQLDFDVLR